MNKYDEFIACEVKVLILIFSLHETNLLWKDFWIEEIEDKYKYGWRLKLSV